MSKLFLTVVASGLLLAGSASVFADDGYTVAQNGNSAAPSSVGRNPAPPVQATPSARRFYSYQPPAARGRRVVAPPYIRPAAAKALGNY